MQNKIIFIKQNKALIFEVNPADQFIEFNNNILIALLTDVNEDESPIKLSIQSKKKVIDLLKCNYSNVNEVKRLINFFDKMSDGEYLYIYPYFKESEELYDSLKESLEPYNKGLDEDELVVHMEKYFQKMNSAKRLMGEMPYKINMFAPNKKKQYLGESDKTKRECIYCSGSVSLKTATFKTEAHAIPEALGNKTYIQNEECDTCNNEFAKNIEEDLCTYLIPDRLMFGIRGKEGWPIFQFNSNYARYIDTENEDFSRNWGKFEYTKQLLILQRPFKGGIILGHDNIDKTTPFNIEYVKGYTMQNAYKAMTKCVIGVMNKGFLSYFKETINWIKETTYCKPLPPIIILECAKICLEPELYVFERKNDDFNLPYCYGELRIAKKIFIFIIPFSSKDNFTLTTAEQFKIFENLICNIYSLLDNNYQVVDFSGVDKQSIDIPLEFKKEIKMSDEFKI